MAGELRGRHSTIVDSEVVTWLLQFGDVSPGIITNRNSSQSYITIKEKQGYGWISIKVLNEMAQELKYFHDKRYQYPWEEGNIPDSISKKYIFRIELPEDKK